MFYLFALFFAIIFDDKAARAVGEPVEALAETIKPLFEFDPGLVKPVITMQVSHEPLIELDGLFRKFARSFDPDKPRYAITIAAEIQHLFALGDLAHHAINGLVRVVFGRPAATRLKELEQFAAGYLVLAPGLVAIATE